MKIGILGSGNVGQALGLGFAGRGHDVLMGTRDPTSEAATAWALKAGANASVVSYSEAAAWCGIAIFAPSWTHTQDVVDAAGAGNLSDKIVIDVTNPVGPLPDGGFGLLVSVNEGAGVLLQGMLPSAHVVKAFNSVGAALMVDPQFMDGTPTMPYCGNDPGAKQEVSAILAEFGWEPVDLGGIEFAGFIEALAVVWMRYGSVTENWTHAFKMLVAG